MGHWILHILRDSRNQIYIYRWAVVDSLTLSLLSSLFLSFSPFSLSNFSLSLSLSRQGSLYPTHFTPQEKKFMYRWVVVDSLSLFSPLSLSPLSLSLALSARVTVSCTFYATQENIFMYRWAVVDSLTLSLSVSLSLSLSLFLSLFVVCHLPIVYEVSRLSLPLTKLV